MPPVSCAETSNGGWSVMNFPSDRFRRLPAPGPQGHKGHLHYTMMGMENKSMEGREHPWKVTTAEARAIQKKLREKWEGEDRLGRIRTVAGLDAAFVVTGSQALNKKTNLREQLRAANQAIGCVVAYRYPEMEEIAREFAIVPLEF